MVNQLYEFLRKSYDEFVYRYDKNNIIFFVIDPLEGSEESKFPEEFAKNVARIYNDRNKSGIESKINGKK